MPETPDECVAAYDTGGFDPEPGYSYERPTFQIVLRGAKRDYRGIYALARPEAPALRHFTARFEALA